MISFSLGRVSESWQVLRLCPRHPRQARRWFSSHGFMVLLDNMLQRKILISCEKYGFVEENLSLLFYAWIHFCPAGVGGGLVDRHLQELRQVRDGCIGRASQEEQLRLRLQELGLPLNGRRRDDISLRKLSEAMDIGLQHPSGDRKGRDELVEALVSALLSEVPVLGNLHMSFVDACLKDLREVRDSVSGQAPQRDELEKRLRKFAIKDKRDHVVTLTDLCRSLELPIAKAGGGGMSQLCLQNCLQLQVLMTVKQH